ncbi:MAG: hypothetical protein ACJ8F7_03560, partial [Gemmataceae bacterium]
MAGSTAFWLREEFIRFGRRLGCQCDGASQAAADAVAAALRTAFVAVGGGGPLLLTLVAMVMVVAGRSPEGPAAGTLFDRLGWTWSHGLPLGLVAVALVGHALRERQPVHALLGGLLTQLLVCGGFVVGVVSAGRPFTGDAWIILFQRFTIAAAVWAIGWLVVARWLGRFRTVERGEGRRLPSPVWNAQLALAIGGNIVTLALAALVLGVPSRPLLEGAKPTSSYAAPLPWLAQVGAWVGWLALGLTVAASALRARLAGLRLSAPLVGFASLAAVVLLACPLADVNDGWGYRTLMLGWAGCALEWALLAGRRDERHGGTDVWVAVSAALAVGLALKAAFIHGDQRLAAGAVALCSIGGIWLARRRQRDDWAFVGGLGVQVAVSLLVWHRYSAQPIGDWVVYLLQANAIASAFVALDWLRLRSAWITTSSIFPRVQFAMPATCLAILALMPLPNLLLWPQELRRGPLFQVGEWTGWAALLAVTVAWWVGERRLPIAQPLSEPARSPLRLWPVFALFAGIFLACTIARWDGGRWLSYHAMLLTWAAAAAALLAVYRDRAVGWVTLLVVLVPQLAVRAAGAGEPLRRIEALLLAGFGLLLQLVCSVRVRDDRDRLFTLAQAASLAVALALSAVIAAVDTETVGRLLGPIAAAVALVAAVLLTYRADGQSQRVLTYSCLCLPVLLVA